MERRRGCSTGHLLGCLGYSSSYELVALEAEEFDVRARDDRRRSWYFAQERDLAKVVAGAELRRWPAPYAHVRLARSEDVEAVARGSLAHDLLAGLDSQRPQTTREVLERRRRQGREHRQAAKEGELSLGHRDLGVDPRKPGPGENGQNRKHGARCEESAADPEERHEQRRQDRPQAEGGDEQALDHAEHARQHLVGRRPLE